MGQRLGLMDLNIGTATRQPILLGTGFTSVVVYQTNTNANSEYYWKQRTQVFPFTSLSKQVDTR